MEENQLEIWMKFMSSMVKILDAISEEIHNLSEQEQKKYLSLQLYQKGYRISIETITVEPNN